MARLSIHDNEHNMLHAPTEFTDITGYGPVFQWMLVASHWLQRGLFPG